MSSDWGNLDVVRAILTASTCIPFVLFGSAGVWHFGGDHKSGTKLVSMASLLGFAAVIYTLWTREGVYVWSVLGVSLQLLATFLFGWCIGTSGRRNLALALSENASKKLITEGPYALVRHPFYTSYILFWIGGVAVASSLFTVLTTLLLIFIYFYTSRREDEVLARVFADEFPQWHERTGAFFPKWR